MKSVGAIAFDLRVSRLLVAAVAAVVVLALAAIWLSRLREWPWFAAAASLALAGYAAYALSQPYRLRWRRVGWNADGSWLLQDADHAIASAQLQGWSAFGLTLLLRLRSAAGEPVLLFLLPDNLDRDTRRRLRVRLSQQAAAPPPLRPS